MNLPIPVVDQVTGKQEQDVIIVPAVSNEEAERLFDKGFTQFKPYLRTTPQPNL